MRNTCLIAALALAFSQTALANPTGGTVTGGSGTISQSGSTVTVTTTTNNTVINWQSFSVGAGETTRFNQPSSSSTVLNRVTGPDSSSIAGTLSSNGNVFLVNPNGVVVAPGAQIDVASLLVTTMSVDDASFLSGSPVFSGNGTINIVGGTPSTPISGTTTAAISGGGLITTGGSTITLNSSSTSGVITSGGFNIGSGQNISLSGTGTSTIGTLTAASSEGGRGIIAILSRSGTTVAPTPAPAVVASAGMPRAGEIAVNLEKREVPF